MNCVLIDSRELEADGHVRLTDERAAHIRRVLNKETGDRIRVGRLNGPLGEGEIVELTTESIRLHCTWQDQSPPVPNRSLLLAMPRPKVMRRLFAPLAGLGLRQILICNAAKVERYYFDSRVLTPEVIRRELIRGLQQAIDTHVPEVQIHTRFRPMVEDQLPVVERRIALQPDAPVGLKADHRETLLAIGPEGGWTEFELKLLQANGFETAHLGSRVLTTDVACCVALGRWQ